MHSAGDGADRSNGPGAGGTGPARRPGRRRWGFRSKGGAGRLVHGSGFRRRFPEYDSTHSATPEREGLAGAVSLNRSQIRYIEEQEMSRNIVWTILLMITVSFGVATAQRRSTFTSIDFPAATTTGVSGI